MHANAFKFFSIVAGLMVGSVGTGLTLSTLRPASTELRPEFLSPQTFVQQVARRSWRPVTLLTPQTVPTAGMPSLVAVDAQGSVYVVDGGDGKLKKYSRELSLVYVFPSGSSVRLNGPITHLVIRHDGAAVLTQPRTKEVTIVAPDGNSSSVVTFAPAIKKVGFCSSETTVGMPEALYEHSFQLHDPQTWVPIRRLGPLVNHQADVALAMDGTIASEPTAGCVYVSRYLGIIVAIATDGSTRYIARTIAPDPPPRVLSTPEGQRRVLQEDVRHVVRSASLDRGRLFTLTTTQDHNNSVLDVYSFADGNYAYSAKLADGTWQFVVADSYAYAVVDNVLTRWTLQSNSRP